MVETAGRVRRRLEGLDLPAWFLLLGATFGVALVVFIPPSQGLDEPNHFFRVYSITQGRIVTPIPHGRAGVVVPACTYEYVNDLYVVALHPANYVFGDFWKTPPGCAGRPGEFVPVENTAVNSPVSYLPEETAVLLLRVVGAPVPVIFFGGRLAGLGAYLALIYAAIRVAPRGKAVFFVLGVLPSSLTLASGYSADGMTIGLALLSSALALRCLLDQETDRRWFLALSGSLLALAVTKNTYFVLAPLLLLVPASRLSKEGRGRRPLLAKGAALLVIAVATLGWYRAVRDVSLAAYAGDGRVIDPHTQIAFILHHPVGYAHILARSMLQAAPEGYYIPGFVQSLGFFRTPVRGSPLAPVGLVVIAVLVLAAAYRGELGPRRDALTRVDRAAAALPLALGAVSVLVILSALWWQWTQVGELTVRGVQGRYFLPLAPLPLITIAVMRHRPARRPRFGWIVLGSAAMLLYTVVKVAVLFY